MFYHSFILITLNLNKQTNKYFNTEITKLLIELFQLLRASQYSHLLFLRYPKAICEVLS